MLFEATKFVITLESQWETDTDVAMIRRVL